jgi:O-antigen/teichoic acid export membrane protein
MIAGTAALISAGAGWLPGAKILKEAAAQASLKGVIPAMVSSASISLAVLFSYATTAFEVPLLGLFLVPDRIAEYRVASSISDVVNGIVFIAAQLVFPKILDWAQAGPSVLWRNQLRLALLFSLVALLGILCAFLLSATALRIIFGERYAGAWLVLALLVAGRLTAVIVSVFVNGLLALRRDRAVLALTLVVATFALIGNVASVPVWGINAAAFVNFVSQMLLLLGSFGTMWIIVRRDFAHQRDDGARGT